MNLSDEEVKRFYRIWFTLLDYTNEKYKVLPKFKDLAHSTNIPPEEIAPIKDRLWKDNSVLNEIVRLNPYGFSDADLLIVSSWKNRVSDRFILLKHLKKYSIFLGDQQIYGVIGIVSPFEEMFPSFALPVIVDAVLLPFEGKIIYDSLLRSFPMRFGGGAKKNFQEDYREIKANSGIITSLN